MMITGFLLIEGVFARPSVPDWHELRAAMHEQIGNTPSNYRTGVELTDHPVTECARRLAELHHIYLRYPEHSNEIDGCRIALVAAIDRWVRSYVRPRTTTTLGAAADSLAAAYVQALDVLEHAERGSDMAVHRAWSDLGFHATQWSDLVAEVVHGQRPLP
ncbi:DUF4254 domain-containing protein [Nocardia sp. CA-120079]|uniref:DUF4254 domain-containing protein n=1 Tax=Nocardia sp. CA-120079 TaxID=3239974 RepID=UPI003D9860BE